MNPAALKLTDEIAAVIRARVKTLDFKTVEKLRKAKDENGTFDVIISTEDTDRSGEIVKQTGWELTNYKNNPIVLWGHDYYSLPVGVCTDTYLTEKNGIAALGARGVFLSADINPFAQQVRKLYEFGLGKGEGVGCTTSVGFIPKEFDENARNTITKAELLEFSFVPIPANQGVGPAQGRHLTFDEAKELRLDVAAMRMKGMFFTETLGYVPKNVSDETASAGTAWSKPSLKDFTDKEWGDLSAAEKTHIAGHFAWAKENPAASFGDLKLPHHEAKSGAAVWNGVKAAMGALMGARGGVDVEGDKKAVYEHLAAHYRQFEKEPPELKTLKEAQPGDACSTDDGSPGILTSDPNDPDGALVCLPQDEDKSKSARTTEKDLHKSLRDEQDRHSAEIEKAIDEFRTKTGSGGKAKPEAAMRESMKDLRDSLRDEHNMHRANTVKCFRSFEPTEDKAFDKKEHLKTLRDEHDSYETKCEKATDDFDEKCMKAVQDGESTEGHTDNFSDALDRNHLNHKKAVTRIANKMCKDAFGEEDRADEKTLEILKEHLSAYVPEEMQAAVFQKTGARISAATKEKLGEAHEHLKAASAIVKAIHGGLGDDDGEEGRSADDKSEPAPRKQRSRPTEVAANEDINDFLFGRTLAKEIVSVAQRGLEHYNKKAKQ